MKPLTQIKNLFSKDFFSEQELIELKTNIDLNKHRYDYHLLNYKMNFLLENFYKQGDLYLKCSDGIKRPKIYLTNEDVKLKPIIDSLLKELIMNKKSRKKIYKKSSAGVFDIIKKVKNPVIWTNSMRK